MATQLNKYRSGCRDFVRQLGELKAVSQLREWLDPDYRCHRKVRVEMRKKRTSAGRLPFQVCTKFVAVYRDKKKFTLASEMFLGCFDDLVGCREMNKAVFEIDRRANKLSGSFGFLPGWSFGDLINDTIQRFSPFCF